MLSVISFGIEFLRTYIKSTGYMGDGSNHYGKLQAIMNFKQ